MSIMAENIKLSLPTPHIGAKYGDFAKTVLMPGDPLRAKFIAETYLENAKLVTEVRSMLGYTGTYKGVPVSVMASGMGMPSMGIYSYELFSSYGVENIIRIGTAGAISDSLKLRDIVLGIGSCTNSNYAVQYRLPGTFAPTADFTLLSKAYESAFELGQNAVVGNLLCSDTFYDDNPEALNTWKKMGVLAVEMESAALYMNAARLSKRALTMCTVSDAPLRGESLSSDERQTGFTHMMETALETVRKL